MKPVLFIFLGLLAFDSLFAQNQYEVIPESSGEKIWKGLFSREQLEKDSAFSKWYAPSLRGFTPNAGATGELKKNADSVRFIVFMGTWCEDSHFVIPKFFSLADAAGIARERVSLIGVDRDKKTLGNLTEAMNITNVPTIIIMKNGKELGRVVEYGKSGLFDKDLGQVINPAL